MNGHFGDIESLSEPKTKSWFLTEPQMQFLSAAISLAGVMIALYAHQRKDVILVAIVVPGLIFLLSLLPGIISVIKGAYHRSAQRQFVRREYPRLRRLYQRLISYTDRNDGRSLRGILYSASAYRHDIVDKLLGCDYIWTWIECYGTNLTVEKPRSLLSFMQRCNELTAILSEYNRHYAHRTQKGIEQTPLEQEHIVDQLEAFRDDFNQYLRDVEEWSVGINAAFIKLEPSATSHMRIFGCTSFDKLKTFRKAKSTGS